MDLCAEAIVLFCRDQGVVLPADIGMELRLQLQRNAVLQFERYDGRLTVWLCFSVTEYERPQAVKRALACVFSGVAPSLPVRCGMLGDGRMALLVTLGEGRASVQLLHEIYRTLLGLRAQVAPE